VMLLGKVESQYLVGFRVDPVDIVFFLLRLGLDAVDDPRGSGRLRA
jgi:hypothetical protein